MRKKWIITVSLLVFLLYLILSLPYYSGDIKNYLVWSESILKDGPFGLYDRTFHDFFNPNYPPVAMLLFTLSLWLYKQSLFLIWMLNLSFPFFPSNLVHFFQWENVEMAFFKLPGIFANIGLGVGSYLIYGMLKKKAGEWEKILASILFLLNPAAIYISIIWGQIDTLPLAFLMFAIYFLYKAKILLAFFLATLMLLSKQSAIIFWALFALLAIKLYGFNKLKKGFLLTVVVFYLSYLPFHQFSLTWPINLYYTHLSLVSSSATSPGAFNFWGILSSFELIDDSGRFLSLTYQSWGYLLFSIIFLPVLIIFFKRKQDLYHLVLTYFIFSISFFLFLTRMHERYLIPAVLFSSLLVLKNKKHWLFYIFFSLLHFLNLYKGLLQPDFPILVFLVKDIFFLQVLVVIYMGMMIYSLFLYAKDK